MHTAHILAASLLVTAIVALLGYSIISMMHHNPPVETPVDITSSVLIVDCDKTTMSVGGLRYDVATAMYTILGLGARNAIDRQLIIDAVAMKSPNITIVQLAEPMVLPPRREAYREILTPWFNHTLLARRVKPGDVYRVDGTSLTLLQSGPYFEYLGSIPVIEPPSQYNSPFRGNTPHQLQVSGTLISSFISKPGYAATQLLSNAPRNDMLILAHVKIETWVNETDIPFYVDFYPGAQALAYRASGTISFTTGGTSVSAGNESYIGVYLESFRTSLHLQDDTYPRVIAPPAATTNVNVVAGLARESEVKSRVGFVAYRGSTTSYHVVVFDYASGEYVFFDSSNPNNLRRGNAVVFSNTSYLSISRGQFGTIPILIVYNPTRGQSTWIFTLYTHEGTFRYYLQPVNSTKPISVDFLVLWGDQANPVTGATDDDWRDHVVRVTVFSDGTPRIAVMTAKGGFQHDFYIVVDSVYPLTGTRVYTKPYGASWYYFSDGYYREIPDKIYYPSEAIIPGFVSSHVYYIGAFKSPTLTVYGLYPGDVVTLSTPNRTVSFEVSSSTLSVNLLTTFGPRELVEALKRGGVMMIIRPSTERALLLLQDEVLVHVMGDWVDVWVPVALLLSPKCTLTASGGSGTVVLERRGDFVRVSLTDSKTGSTVLFGTYARVDVDVTGFTITIRYQNGTSETLSPGMTKNGVTITPSIRALVYGDRVFLITSNGIVEVERYSSITISVSGTFTLTGKFGR